MYVIMMVAAAGLLQVERLSWDSTSKLLAAAVGNEVLVW
jgi:hypothetical protein